VNRAADIAEARTRPTSPGGGRARRLLERYIALDTVLLSLLAVLLALVIGAFIIALSDLDALKQGDIAQILRTVRDAYKAIPVGAFGSMQGLSETLLATTPFLIAGLAVTLSFRGGLFNIGATGQMIFGGIAAVWVGFSMHGPGIVQVPLAILAGMVAGGLWGGVAGYLKARTGASEVITTIMLNYIAIYFLQWILKTSTFKRPGRNDPISRSVNVEGRLPKLFSFTDDTLRAHTGILLGLVAAMLVWYLLSRTTTGFEFRALGVNPDAARYAGMRPATLTVLVMLMSGALSGLAGASEVLGGSTGYRMTNTFGGDIGFDAIAVALLGRSTPSGTVFAAFLFGILQGGGREMQVESGVPIDLVLVLRALIVLFIASPLLIRAIFRVQARAGRGSEATAVTA
jgi:simple sugar transport system permease protein